MTKLHVYQVDEGHWYAGESAEAAQAAYISDTDADGAEVAADFGPAIEVEKEALDRLTIVDVDEVGHPTQTFREALNEAMARNETACFIATTEY